MSTDCFCRKVEKQWPFNPGIVFRLPLRRVLLLGFTFEIILASECLRNLRIGSYTSEITFLRFVASIFRELFLAVHSLCSAHKLMRRVIHV